MEHVYHTFAVLFGHPIPNCQIVLFFLSVHRLTWPGSQRPAGCQLKRQTHAWGHSFPSRTRESPPLCETHQNRGFDASCTHVMSHSRSQIVVVSIVYWLTVQSYLYSYYYIDLLNLSIYYVCGLTWTSRKNAILIHLNEVFFFLKGFQLNLLVLWSPQAAYCISTSRIKNFL